MATCSMQIGLGGWKILLSLEDCTNPHSCQHCIISLLDLSFHKDLILNNSAYFSNWESGYCGLKFKSLLTNQLSFSFIGFWLFTFFFSEVPVKLLSTYSNEMIPFYIV